MLRPFIRCSTLSFALSLIAVTATGSPPTLFENIDARLELMDDVAAHKWAARQAIEDVEREQVVLAAARDQALAHGLGPYLDQETSQFFFHIQIEAAKEIQRYWFERFAEGEPVPEAPDLDAAIRPALIRLGDAIAESIAGSRALAQDEQLFRDTVSVTGLSEAMKANLFRALIEIRHFPDRLTQISETGILRVGTTGDYAPFSFSAPDPDHGAESDHVGIDVGIDIDMARDLADYLGVKLVLTRTSWPTLMADLESGAFDIGMSGISVTDARELSAFFSQPYFTGGKTPIARCSEAGRFGALDAIDQPGVRVIVNPGGTNFAFTDANIKQAAVTVHDDNRTIFDEIVAGRADVMITDAIEVKLKSMELPTLCATMPDRTLTHQDKGYLMPRDEKLRTTVSRWLAERLEDGTFERIYATHMNPD